MRTSRTLSLVLVGLLTAGVPAFAQDAATGDEAPTETVAPPQPEELPEPAAAASDDKTTDAASADRPARPRLRRFVQGLFQLRDDIAQPPEVPRELAIEAMQKYMQSLLKDQELTPDERQLYEQFAADPLAQEIYLIRAQQSVEPLDFETEELNEFLESIRPEIEGEAQDEDAWIALRDQVISELDNLPDLTADSDVNRLLDSIFRSISIRLGDKRRLGAIETGALGMTFRTFLRMKKADNLEAIAAALATADAIRTSGADPQQALEDLRRGVEL